LFISILGDGGEDEGLANERQTQPHKTPSQSHQHPPLDFATLSGQDQLNGQYFLSIQEAKTTQPQFSPQKVLQHGRTQ
jgi:hypothetical protein